MNRRIAVYWAVTMSMVAACSDEGGASSNDAVQNGIPTVISVEPMAGPALLTVAQDLDPQPNVVEVYLEAKVSTHELAPGVMTELWTYNGFFPGPTIEAKVGDTVRVRLANKLPEATTIHWHGLRVPASMDGVPTMQSPIQPGQEFTYEFVVPDAGTFWYHPHIRSDVQVERGLLGVVVVRGENEPATTTDTVVVLDDVLVLKSGELVAFGADQVMVGRQGNLLLANGKANPTFLLQPNGIHRFRFVNGANARFFRLRFDGASAVQIGTDGGLLPSPQALDELLLVPGERAELVVTAHANAGKSTSWVSAPYDRGHGTGAAPEAVVFMTKTHGDAVEPPPMLPSPLTKIEALGKPVANRTLVFQEMEGMNHGTGSGGGGHAGHGDPTTGGGVMPPMFMFNGKMWPNPETFSGHLGTTEDWVLDNQAEMDHPFHLHGFRFQLVDADGQASPQKGWRDTVNVAAKQKVTIRVDVRDNAGEWMFHCHILEHAENGMVGIFNVAPDGGP